MATPTLIQNASYASTSDVAGDIYHLPFPRGPTGANNCVLISFTWNLNPTLTSVQTIDASGAVVDTLSALVAQWTDTNNQNHAWYIKSGCTAGAVAIKVTFGGTPEGNFYANISEWYNVATSSASDGTNHASIGASTTAWQSGSITTVSDGDLILQSGAQTQVQAPGYDGTGFTADTGYTFLNTDLSTGWAVQYKIQTTHGAINPTLTWNPGMGGGSMTVALKSASAGTAPDGTLIRPLNFQITNAPVAATTTWKAQFPVRGGVVVIGFMGTAASLSVEVAISAVSDTSGATWTKRTKQVCVGQSTLICMQFADAQIANPPQLITITVTTTNAKHDDTALPHDDDAGLMIWDVLVPGVTTYVASDSGAIGVSGDGGPNVLAKTQSQKGIVLTIVNQDTGTVRYCASAGAIDCTAFADDYDGGFNTIMRDGGAAYVPFTNGNDVTVTWTGSSSFAANPAAWSCAALEIGFPFLSRLATLHNRRRRFDDDGRFNDLDVKQWF